MSLRVLGTALKLEDYAEEGEGLRTYVAKGAGQEERRERIIMSWRGTRGGDIAAIRHALVQVAGGMRVCDSDV